MAWPTTSLSVLVEFYNGTTWVDITAYTRVADGIQIHRGYTPASDTPEPSSCTLTLDNRDGRFSPRKPTGPYYELIGRNTPLRVTANGSVRFYGEISEWPVGWDVSGRDAWVSVAAQGILRRLGQGRRPLKSALYRYLEARSGLVAFYPLDEDAPARSWRNLGPSGGYMAVGSLLLASNASAGSPPLQPWLDQSVDLQGASNLRSRSFTTTAVSGAITVAWVSALADRKSGVSVTVNDATAANYGQFFYGREDAVGAAGHLYVNAVDTGNAAELNVAGDSVLLWIGHLTNSGGSLLWSLTVYDDLGSQIFTRSGTAGGGTGPMTTVGSVIFESPFPDGRASMSDLAVINANVTDADIIDAYRGYPGETAGARFLRMCTEEGVTSSLVGSAADTEQMGAQPAATLVEVITEAYVADMGLLYEDRTAAALVYRTRRDLYAQTAALALNYAGAGEVAPPLDPTDDDRFTRNDIEVKRKNGASLRVIDTTSALSTQDPPDGVGTYDTQVEVNVADDAQLQGQAYWRLHLGTVDEARYPTIHVNLRALAAAGKTSLVTAAAALDIGDRVTISSPPAWLPPDTIDVLAVGFDETVGAFDWDIVINAVPARPYAVAVVGTNRIGSATSTLSSGIASGTTSLSVANTGPLWSTSASGFQILIGGEVMTVTAISGASSPQTFTVTRSTNGVVKSHSAGAAVALAQPAIVGLG